MKGKKDIVNMKDIILEALAKCNGNVSEMCRQINMSRTHFYRLYNSDPELVEACKAVKEMMKDNVEGVLYQMSMEKNIAAVIFYLKTQARDRGYIENPSMNINMAENITEVVINVKGRDE